MVSENGGPAAITSAIDPNQSDDEFPSLGVSRGRSSNLSFGKVFILPDSCAFIIDLNSESEIFKIPQT